MDEIDNFIRFELKLFLIKIVIGIFVLLVGVVVFMELEWIKGDLILEKFDVIKLKESLVEKYNISVIDLR